MIYISSAVVLVLTLVILLIVLDVDDSSSNRYPISSSVVYNRSSLCADAPVAVYFTGGLGNHLFCAAFGIALALNRSGTTEQLVFGAVPTHDLRYSQVSPAYATFFSGLNITSNLESVVSLWARDARAVTRITLTDSSDFCRLVSVTPSCGSVQVALGYFQNIDYFYGIAQTLRNMFKVPVEAVEEFQIKYPLGASSWAIHVRRGDYVAKSELHNLLSLDYFEAAIHRMNDSMRKTAFVFSDDIEWVKRQDVFQNIPNVIFVDEKNTLRAFYFMILAAEDGLICSNSTFCWWVAFLSEKSSNSRLVFFPERWDIRTTLSGVLNDRDCGAGLLLPFATTLSGF